MRVVLDSNVLLSALISPYGTADLICRSWQKSKFELVTSDIQLEEIKRASRYPKFKNILQPVRVGTLVNNLQRAIVLENLEISKEEVKDPEDAFLISMAIAGEADYLITGDYRAGLLERKHIERTRILTPSTFCKKILRQINERR